MSKNPCFLRHFWIFFKLGAILARQTSCCMFSGSWRIFWHPWDPWGRINSGDTRVLRFVFDFFACQRPLADFFHSSQIEARCHFYWFDMNKSENITFYSHNGWVFKVIQAVSIVIWMDSEQISPVCHGLFNFGSILAHQISNGIFSEFYTLWDPGGASIVERKDFQAKRPLCNKKGLKIDIYLFSAPVI